jgi:hypothetical protein
MAFGFGVDGLPGAIRLADDRGWSEITYEDVDGDPGGMFVEALDEMLSGTHTPGVVHRPSMNLVYWTFDRLPDGRIHLTVAENPNGPFVFETAQSPDAFRTALGRGRSGDSEGRTGPSAGSSPVMTDGLDGVPREVVDEVDDFVGQDMLAAAQRYDFVETVEFVDEDPRRIAAPTSREW